MKFTYDPLGRRLTKAVYTPAGYGWKETSYESYLYDGQNEIGAFTASNTPKNLRVLGRAIHKEHPATIALELEGQMFAPILDVQGNIVRLISPDSNTISQSYKFSAFGELLSDQQQQSYWSLLGYSEPTNPWRFASKRYDPELGLIYYGKRYYDPESARWLTTDPAGFIDSANLYQYLFNNPLHYFDPDGQFAFVIPFLIWGVEAAFPALSAYAAPLVYGAITGAVAYGGYKIAQAINKPEDNYSPAEDYARYVRECEASGSNNEKTDPGTGGNSPNDGNKEEKKTPGNLQKQVEQGKAPKSVDRADKGRGEYEKDHVHFKDGSALNSDGTWKHGGKELTKQEIEWLKKNGWNSPQEY